MFESSLIKPGAKTSRPMAVTLSATLQAAVTAAVLIYPLLRIEKLPPVKLVEPRPVFNAVKLVEVPRAVAASAPALRTSMPFLASRVFTAPPRVPSSVDMSMDATEIAQIGHTVGDPGPYVPDSIPWSASSGPPAPVPPPPPPAKRPDPPPPPKPAGTARIKVGGNVRPPRLIHEVKPVYPPLARQARIQGVVRLTAIVATNGTVHSLAVISGHPLLVNAAVEAVRQWRYEPTRLNDDPVEVVLAVDVNFTLQQ